MGRSYGGWADPVVRPASIEESGDPMTDKLRRAWAYALRLAPFAMFAMLIEPAMRRW
jgi:hypothetical protein